MYLPNHGQICFLEKALDELSLFTEGIFLIGGDFNFVLDPKIDSTAKKSHLTY